jgi:hypothetical protein
MQAAHAETWAVGGRYCHRRGVRLGLLSTDDQRKASEIHGEALKLARGQVRDEPLDRIAAAAEGNDRLRVETVGQLAGSLLASHATHDGHELVAAELLSRAGNGDGHQLIEAVCTGYDHGEASLQATIRAANT